MPHKNLETLSVVWLCKSFNSVQEHVDAQQRVRNTINHLSMFFDAELCEKYLQSTDKDDQIILILSGLYDNKQLERVYHLTQVIAVYVYEVDDEDNRKKMGSNKKVKHVTTKLEEILKDVCSQRRSRNHDLFRESLSITSVHEDNDQDTSTVELNGQFVHSQLIIDCLLRMPFALKDKIELLSILREQYSGNAMTLAFLNEFEEHYSSDRAVWWYTRESPLYRILNKALRVQNTELLFLLRFFIHDLQQQLEKNKGSSSVCVYRAQLMSKDELQRLKNSIGKLISINSFLSTTLHRETALFYFTESSTPDNLQEVLFEIIIDPQLNDVKTFANITKHSYFSEEEEVLITLGSIYRVTSVNEGSRLCVIRMILCSDTEHDLKPMLDHLRLKYGSGPTNLLSFGAVLHEMGKFDGAEKYYHRLLNELVNNDDLESACYHALGSIASEKGDYDSSLIWHKKSLAIHQRLQDTDNLAYNYNSIGVIHQKRENYKEALESYGHAYRIWKEKTGENHPKVAMCLSNMGGVYQAENKYSKALECHQQALVIWQMHLTTDCFQLGVAHNNIGCIFGCLGDYDHAMQHYDLALTIYKRCLPPIHPTVAKTLENIGLILFLMKNQEESRIYYERAAIIYGQSLPKSHPKIAKIEHDIQCVLSGTLPSFFHFWWLDMLKVVNEK
ncbi:unnamed protein product [Rotaria magnacalcarata]|nr:unnamed protein product [Rotaria magnacalcarata]